MDLSKMSVEQLVQSGSVPGQRTREYMNELATRLRAAEADADELAELLRDTEKSLAAVKADLAAAKAEAGAYREALTPDADTKYAYHGEFWWEEERPTIDEDGDMVYSTVKYVVPWTTIKEIMAAINKRAESTLATPAADPQVGKEAP